MKGKKAHGWIGCAASETAAVHYGLVSGAKPCSWAASPRSASPRHLATGGVGRVEEGADSGRCAVRSVPPHPEVLYSQPVPRFRPTPRGRGGAGEPVGAACCNGWWARSNCPSRRGPGFGQTAHGQARCWLPGRCSGFGPGTRIRHFDLGSPSPHFGESRGFSAAPSASAVCKVEAGRPSGRSEPHRRVSRAASSPARFGGREEVTPRCVRFGGQGAGRESGPLRRCVDAAAGVGKVASAA